MVHVRFAPSPTGYLHVGNARIAVANALFALRYSGKFTLRLDDTDLERSRDEYAEAIAQDLRWMGIEWADTFRQRDNMDRYEAAADALKASGRLYPCFESEEELRYKRELRLKQGRAPVYDRAMLKMTPEQRAQAEANGKRPYWRFLLSDRTVGWRDGVLGPRQVKLQAISDPVVIRADGTPLYTFTSVVDDIATGVTHIIRGEDHISNSGVQTDLFEALGKAAPALAHLPLLTDADGGKLSKRIDSLTLRSLARDGIEPVALVSYLARLGSSRDPQPLTLAELAQEFDLDAFSASSARFDGSQLAALNRRTLQTMPFSAVQDRLPQGATEAFWEAVRGNLDMLAEARLWWDVVAGSIVPPVLTDEDNALLKQALPLLPQEPWDTTTWSVWTRAVKEASDRSGRALFRPLRLALTGEEHGPELAALLPLMGAERVRTRLTLTSGAMAG
ncbi:glutamate--tRNA ligase [Granulibacter bethesdensis]|uniref:glutamate--tRNA ligase n=1 Tax=Granulibacter bethesdensis TaxID=364410 RepID=UPI0003F1F4B3|nr:glutamate--tRNA ligase [Granulibacter bethesdensis]AHJ68771.1 Glutamyl-tRNA synthetase [Granulibacter bethesdensis]